MLRRVRFRTRQRPTLGAIVHDRLVCLQANWDALWLDTARPDCVHLFTYGIGEFADRWTANNTGMLENQTRRARLREPHFGEGSRRSEAQVITSCLSTRDAVPAQNWQAAIWSVERRLRPSHTGHPCLSRFGHGPVMVRFWSAQIRGSRDAHQHGGGRWGTIAM